MKEAVKPGVLPILHSLSFLLWSALSGRSLQYDPHQTEEPPCQAHCLIRQNCAVGSSTHIPDSGKDCAESEYTQKKSLHREHEQPAGDSEEQSLQTKPQ